MNRSAGQHSAVEQAEVMERVAALRQALQQPAAGILQPQPGGGILQQSGGGIRCLSEGLGGPTATMSTGCESLDRRLPGGGWHPGQLVEWLTDDVGGGAELFALQAIRAAVVGDPRRVWVVMDRDGAFYPPVTVGWGLDVRQMIVVRPQSRADELWALDQVLRCRAIAIVLAWFPQLAPRDFRRLQLAAEAGGAIGCLIRPAEVQGEPSWADIQLRVRSLPTSSLCRCWQLDILRCRGGRAGQSFQVECDEPSGRMRELTS